MRQRRLRMSRNPLFESVRSVNRHTEHSGSYFSELMRITEMLLSFYFIARVQTLVFFPPRSSSPPQQTSAAEVAIRQPAAPYTPTLAFQCLSVLENEELPNYPDTLLHSIPTR